MKNKGIRIIKRINAAAAKVIAIAEIVRTDKEISVRHGQTVNAWIAERRENSRLERIFTNNRIVAWKAEA